MHGLGCHELADSTRCSFHSRERYRQIQGQELFLHQADGPMVLQELEVLLDKDRGDTL
jgi:hypothetical protein